MNETWKDIRGFENRYQASDLGRIRSLITNKILAPVCVGDYATLSLYDKNGIKNVLLIHILVADTFLGIVPNDQEVNHINGDKLDNRLINLEYLTRSGNMKHAIKLGLVKPPHPGYGENHHSTIAKDRQEKIKELYKVGNTSIRKLAKQFNHSPVTIFKILHNRI